MNINCIRNLMMAVIFGCLVVPLTVSAHKAVDPLHATPVETVDSRLTTPTSIHVQVTDQGVEVEGKIKRKGHKSMSLRGHVDVELLDSIGRVLESGTVRLSPRSGTAKHDHDRDFSVVLALPEAQEYSVRVTHNVGGHEH